MNEQALLTLLGGVSTALVTAVGGLAWAVRRNGHRGNPNGLEHSLKDIANKLDSQKEVLERIATSSAAHNTEAPLRHNEMMAAFIRLEQKP